MMNETYFKNDEEGKEVHKLSSLVYEAAATGQELPAESLGSLGGVKIN